MSIWAKEVQEVSIVVRHAEEGYLISGIRLWAISVILLGVTNAVLGLVGIVIYLPIPVLPLPMY